MVTLYWRNVDRAENWSMLFRSFHFSWLDLTRKMNTDRSAPSQVNTQDEKGVRWGEGNGTGVPGNGCEGLGIFREFRRKRKGGWEELIPSAP